MIQAKPWNLPEPNIPFNDKNAIFFSPKAKVQPKEELEIKNTAKVSNGFIS